MPEPARPTKITFGEAPEQNNVAFISVLGATLLAASLMQTAVAAEHHRATRARAPVSASQHQVVAAPSPAEANREYWRARGLASGGPSALRR
jgi:hypothetical protein